MKNPVMLAQQIDSLLVDVDGETAEAAWKIADAMRIYRMMTIVRRREREADAKFAVDYPELAARLRDLSVSLSHDSASEV